ncbi:MAG: RND family transporter [Bacteriovoracaceae bacterium]|nr:RND family transporter [Deltaproteobacteria bacterium]NLW66782.1 RND family transporter [Bacteriovoracaceae bacterium]HRR20759.1 efflux RND transporter permease subunit [Desulfomonilia bacterium]HOE73665.1 efflux RND transporter permease subunit [Deltaproteobacteria bacterium]HOS28037.1 efflux RND transporter permease subunit [Deltaproteobacteria bacterium]
MERVIRFCLEHPWRVILAVAAVTLFFGLQVPKITMDPRVEVVLRDDNPEVEIFVANKHTFEPYADILIGMINTGDIFNPVSLEKLGKIALELEEIAEVKKVTCLLNVKNIQGSESGLDVSPMVSDTAAPLTQADIAALKDKVDSWEVYRDTYITRDGCGTGILVVLQREVQTDQIVPIYYAITDILSKYEGPEKFYISGTKVVEALQSHYMIKDLILLPPLVCVVLLTFLFLFFRNIRGTLLPLASVAISAVWTLGLMALVGNPLTLVTTALPVVLIACGSAYGIHVLENVLADDAEGKKGRSGILGAVSRVRMPVAMACMTTMAAFISFTTSTIVPLMNMGLFAAFGLCVSMMLALTFIPALLSLIDAHGGSVTHHYHSSRDYVGPILKRLSYLGIRKSRWVIAASFAVLAVSIFLGRHVKSDLNLVEDFRERSPIRIADTVLNQSFGGTSVFHVVFETPGPDDIKEPAVLRKIEKLQQELMQIEDVGKAVSIVDFIKRMNQAMHDGDPAFYTISESRELVAQYLLLFSFSGGGDELDGFVDYDFQKAQIILQMKSLSGYLARDVIDTAKRFQENELAGHKDTNIITTGLAVMAKEFNRIVVRSQVQTFLISFFLCFLITSGVFRSLRLGVYSMMPLLIPIALDFAIMGVSGIRLNAATATVASIDIGMGIDYSIHFLSRYRHEIRMGLPVASALDRALNTSGRGIVYNALAVAAGFLVLTPSQFVIISQMGILVAVDMLTIALSALTFLPACIMLLPPKLLAGSPVLPDAEIPLAYEPGEISSSDGFEDRGAGSAGGG